MVFFEEMEISLKTENTVKNTQTEQNLVSMGFRGIYIHKRARFNFKLSIKFTNVKCSGIRLI